MRKEAIKRKTNGVTLYSKKVNPKTGKRKVLGRFKSMEAAEKRERQIQYFKHQEGALVDFAKQSIDETLLKQAALKDYLRKARAIPGAIGATLVAKRSRVLPGLAGSALGALTGAAYAPWGYKARTGFAGALAGGVGGAYKPIGALAGPAAGIAVGSHYRKKAKESIRRRAKAKRRAAREAIGSTYMF